MRKRLNYYQCHKNKKPKTPHWTNGKLKSFELELIEILNTNGIKYIKHISYETRIHH